MDRKLKRNITRLWNEITDGQTMVPVHGHMATKSWLKLEILLIQAGLLSEKRAEKPSAQPVHP